jgi:hypothetical protein
MTQRICFAVIGAGKPAIEAKDTKTNTTQSGQNGNQSARLAAADALRTAKLFRGNRILGIIPAVFTRKQLGSSSKAVDKSDRFGSPSKGQETNIRQTIL